MSVEYHRQMTREWKKKHPQETREQKKRYREKNREEIGIRNKKYREENRLVVLVHYGGNPPKCACCGENNINFLTIDHINNDGAEHRKILGMSHHGGGGFYIWLIKNNFPEGFQVLCFNCNCGKEHNDGVCPHKTQMGNVSLLNAKEAIDYNLQVLAHTFLHG